MLKKMFSELENDDALDRQYCYQAESAVRKWN